MPNGVLPDLCLTFTDPETGEEVERCYFEEVIQVNKVVNSCAVNECPVFVRRPVPANFVQGFACQVTEVTDVTCSVPEDNFVVVQFRVTIRWAFLNAAGDRQELTDRFTIQQLHRLEGANLANFEAGIQECFIEPTLPFVQCLAVDRDPEDNTLVRFTLGKAYLLKVVQRAQLEILARIPEMPEPCEVLPEEVCPPFITEAEQVLRRQLIPPQPRFDPLRNEMTTG